MERVEKIVEVRRPIRAVYDQWTRFEDFPSFMAGVASVRQLDDTHLHWVIDIAGVKRDTDVEITEQTPDVRISWRSVAGPSHAGTVRFEAVTPDVTRVRLVMAYEPEGMLEVAGDLLGIIDRHVKESVERFKALVEREGQRGPGWRGSVHDSRTV